MSSRRPEEFLPSLQKIDFVTQPEDTPVVCTACSLVNALKLKGAVVHEGESDLLIQRVLENQAPLSDEEDQEFVARYGYTLRAPWAPPEEQIATFPQAIEAIKSFITDHTPVIVKISTHLSKRDRSVIPKVLFTTNLPLTHRVVVCAEGDSVGVIDPYMPHTPEVFSMKDQEKRIRLTAWLFSAFFQTIHPEDQLLDREQLLRRATGKIANPIWFSNNSIFGFLQAGFRYFEKQ